MITSICLILKLFCKNFYGVYFRAKTWKGGHSTAFSLSTASCADVGRLFEFLIGCKRLFVFLYTRKLRTVFQVKDLYTDRPMRTVPQTRLLFLYVEESCTYCQ